MTKRQAITPQMKTDAIFYRLATMTGLWVNWPDERDAPEAIYLMCGICGHVLEPGQAIEWDHIHAISMHGPHEFKNIRPTHKACNQAKGIKEHKAAAKVLRILADKPSKRPMQNSGRKLPSRPFQKVHRPMSSNSNKPQRRLSGST